jgi:hypothetical protein
MTYNISIINIDMEVFMARKSERAKLYLNDEQKAMLTKLSQSRTAPLREVQRANILISI